MFLSNDVVDLVPGGGEVLVEQAVLATAARPLDHLGSEFGRGPGGHFPGRPSARALSMRTRCSKRSNSSNSADS
jgi:hypothetical protein